MFSLWLRSRLHHRMRISRMRPGRPIGKSKSSPRELALLLVLHPRIAMGRSPRLQRGGQEKNGFNRRTGERNRRYGCGSEYHLLPKRPTKMGKKVSAPTPPPSSTPRSPFSSITLEDSPQDVNSAQHSVSTSLTKDRPVFYAQNDSVVILDTGATANLVCFSWLARHNRTLERHEVPRVTTYPALATGALGRYARQQIF